MSNKHRILVMSHAHPDFSLGGGELAAYNLFKSYRNHATVEDAWFIGCYNKKGYPGGMISKRRENDYVWEQAVVDGYTMNTANLDVIDTVFGDFVRSVAPNVIHAHHYTNFGLDTLYLLKRYAPQAKFLLTLHEYWAICLNNGQMVKRNTLSLCDKADPEKCHLCIPEKTMEEIWLRNKFFKTVFNKVDFFIAPSEFLRNRYISWGLPENKIVVIENGQPVEEPLLPRSLNSGETRNRFAFFGQINPYKGLDVLLEALRQIPSKRRKNIILEVHGANLELQEESFRNRIMELREPLMREGVVQWIGPYQPYELRKRMAGIDWVLVPSVWWENSPMVIQEAFNCGRPLLVSDIGGMAEKVRDGVDGLHVQTGNRLAWADALMKCGSDATLWDELRAGIMPPVSHRECAEWHLDVIKNVHKQCESI